MVLSRHMFSTSSNKSDKRKFITHINCLGKDFFHFHPNVKSTFVSILRVSEKYQFITNGINCLVFGFIERTIRTELPHSR